MVITTHRDISPEGGMREGLPSQLDRHFLVDQQALEKHEPGERYSRKILLTDIEI